MISAVDMRARCNHNSSVTETWATILLCVGRHFVCVMSLLRLILIALHPFTCSSFHLLLLPSNSNRNLGRNNLKGTIPSSLASLTQLTYIDLSDNALTGLVPPLPFKQYSNYCYLDAPDHCVEPNCNHFKCPLPAGHLQCKTVHCK